MRPLFITGAFFAFLIAGCTASTEPVESTDNEEIATSESAMRLSEITMLPAYFGIDNRYTPVGDDPWIYAKFTALRGAHVDASVSTDVRGATVGFKLYRVLPNGRLDLLKVVDGPSGEATLRFTSKGAGIYVIEMATSASLSDLVLRLGCQEDKCSPDPQPGDFCGGLMGAHCGEESSGLYCNFEPEALCGAADASGTCALRTQACTKEYMPVCGCDDQTYGNACMAASAGVSVAHEGECSAGPGGGAGEGELCGGFAGFACEEGLYCAYAPEASCGAGDQAGVCAKMPDVCTFIYDPVCGCDGMTYGNACRAASSGISVAHEGECAPPVAEEGESCGGFVMGPPPVCAAGLYCYYAMEDVCGWADAPGTCQAMPEACTKEYNPVCGCDGLTYGNACEAAANGVSVVSMGECLPE